MNAASTIKVWVGMILAKFNQLEIKYAFCKESETHYISVAPYFLVSNDHEYCVEENRIYDLLTQTYPEETFIFGTEGVNFKRLENPVTFPKEVRNTNTSLSLIPKRSLAHLLNQ